MRCFALQRPSFLGPLSAAVHSSTHCFWSSPNLVSQESHHLCRNGFDPVCIPIAVIPQSTTALCSHQTNLHWAPCPCSHWARHPVLVCYRFPSTKSSTKGKRYRQDAALYDLKNPPPPRPHPKHIPLQLIPPVLTANLLSSATLSLPSQTKPQFNQAL